ncbi:MAG: membrane dipeptidase [bacterium]|nr:membrane dipeptidase [bacterium]
MSWQESIDLARQVGLDVLQPTAAQLEHGLKLHRDCLVAESYSLGVLAPLDGDAMARAMDAGAADSELQMLSESMRMTRWAYSADLRAEYQAAWEASGVDCAFQNAGEEGNDALRMLGRLAHYTHLTDHMRDFVTRAAFPDDIERARAAGRRSIVQTCNGIPLAGEGLTMAAELRYVRLFFELGCRMMHLTYNRRNLIGDGCAEPGDAGLSDFGRAAVAELNRQGVIIDVAHSGWQTCLETARASSVPIVSSHATCDALNHHHRAKPDDLMKAIAATGGTVGITNVPAFLGGTACIDAMLDHLDHAIRVVGAEHVTIGTDRPYISVRAAEEAARIPAGHRQRTRWEALWWENDPVQQSRWKQERMMQSTTWTNWPLFTVGLVQRGHSDDDIRAIIGGNILRVARDACAAREI